MRKLWLMIAMAAVLVGCEREVEPVDAQVTLYATSWCGYCAKTRAYFAKHGVEFVEYDIEQDSAAHARFKNMGGNGVPLTVIDYEVIHGYNTSEFDRKLGL